MTAKNKLRGNANENRLVKLFTSYNLKAKRFWASDGRSGGYHQEVDVLLLPSQKNHGELKIQCKKKKKLPDYLGMSENVDAVVFSENYGKQYIMLEVNNFINKYIKED